MSRTFQPLILRFDSLASTNTEAARQATHGAPEGLCVVAREQTRGRGRLGRAWVSPKDAGLYVSILLRPPLAARAWPLLTLAAALAVADALAEACALAVDIKWPNDILARGRKLCGILAETIDTTTAPKTTTPTTPPTTTPTTVAMTTPASAPASDETIAARSEAGRAGGGGRACIVGIGINLTKQAVAPELCATATSVEAETGERPEVEVLLRCLVGAFGSRYARLQASGGAEAIVAEWERRSSYAAGRRVRVALEAEIFEGVTRGLAVDGALRVETFDGKIREVHAGDVTALR